MAKTDLYAQMYHELMAEFGPIVTRGQLHAYKDRTGRGAYQVFGGKKYRVPGSHPAAYDLRKFAAEVNVGDAPTVSSTDTPAQVAPAQGVSSMPVAADLVSVEESSSMSFALPKSSSAADLRSTITALASEASQLARVPEKSSAFVPFGDFDAVKRVIASKVFLPVFITGHSGNGKTFQIEQACAQEKREYIRVNITAETDEDDLIGGFRLKDGETVFELGPIVVAMLRGAVLLLDEVDLAGPKVMCLQPVLEGNALTIKKLGITVKPAPGFTVFATANTKGRGSDDGKYIGTNLLNEAFLERFNFTIEQQYPAVAVEKKILTKTYQALGGEITDEISVFFETLAKWADAIRQTFAEDGIEDIISTRRLVHIVKTYQIFGDQERAMSLCLNRFDVSVKAKFLDFYDKLKPQPVVESPVVESPVAPSDEIPF
jgi:MoxR-like ATPase